MIHTRIEGMELSFETSPSLFSPDRVDRGTLALLSCVRFQASDKILDLGCGYGVVGIFAAKIVEPQSVTLLDNDPAAIAVTERNLVLNKAQGAHLLLSDGPAELTESDFGKILCNPPYHVDFSVPKQFIEKGFNRLALGGAMWMVTKREDWYRNKLRSIFGSVHVHRRDGYFVFEAIKKSHTYANRE